MRSLYEFQPLDQHEDNDADHVIVGELMCHVNKMPIMNNIQRKRVIDVS